MNGKIYIGFLFVMAILSSCMIEEAKPSTHQKVVVYTDSSSPKDSLILQKIRKTTGINAVIIYKSTTEILNEVKRNPYNTKFDCLILSSDSTRKYLKESSLLSVVSEINLSKKLNRQFHRKYPYWIALSHDPLVYCREKDSITNCPRVSWEKLRKDSVAIPLKASKHQSFYAELLSNKSKFSFTTQKNGNPSKNSYITSVSDLAIQSKKNPSFKNNTCFTYLVYNQRYMTNFTSISLYTYGRNKELSSRFIRAYANYATSIASNRNQISTFMGVTPNRLIQQLNIQ